MLELQEISLVLCELSNSYPYFLFILIYLQKSQINLTLEDNVNLVRCFIIFILFFRSAISESVNLVCCCCGSLPIHILHIRLLGGMENSQYVRCTIPSETGLFGRKLSPY